MEENKLMCPIFSLTEHGTRMAVTCQKELCAWWIEDKQKCAIALWIGGKK